MQLAAKNGRYQPHRNVKIRQMSLIWFIIRRTDKISEIRHLSDYPTCYKHCIPPSGTTQGPFRQYRVQERSYSTAIEWSNSRTARRGANSHCKGLHWIQRMLARIRHLLARVHRRGVYDVKRYSYRSIYSNKGMM